MGILNTLGFIANHPLNVDHKLASLLRFARWQIGSRVVDRPVAVTYVDGTRLLVSAGMTGATQNIYCGLHEFEDMAFVLHFLRASDNFVDVGANIGSYTVLAGGAVGASCISVEPIPGTFQHLLDNISLNRMAERVDALNIGLGKENSILRFTSGHDTVNHVLAESEVTSEAIEVPIQTLDDILVDFEPELIKIDVEGFETNVIAGAHKVLQRQSLLGVIMELNGSGDRYGFDENSLHQTMLGYGFMTFTYDPFTRNLISLNVKRSQSGNTLYIRNLDVVESRLKSAPMYLLHNVNREI